MSIRSSCSHHRRDSLFDQGRPRTASSFSTRRTRASVPPRSRSAAAVRERVIDESQHDRAFAESLWQYYRHVAEKIHPPKVGLQQHFVKEPPSRRLRQSGIYRNPALTQGQKLYLLEKCHVRANLNGTVVEFLDFRSDCLDLRLRRCQDTTHQCVSASVGQTLCCR